VSVHRLRGALPEPLNTHPQMVFEGGFMLLTTLLEMYPSTTLRSDTSWYSGARICKALTPRAGSLASYGACTRCTFSRRFDRRIPEECEIVASRCREFVRAVTCGDMSRRRTRRAPHSSTKPHDTWWRPASLVSEDALRWCLFNSEALVMAPDKCFRSESVCCLPLLILVSVMCFSSLSGAFVSIAFT